MAECFECGEPRANVAKCETCGEGEFKPCVVENNEADNTEIVLRDVATVWYFGGRDHELGYDMETGELVAVRVAGIVGNRSRARAANLIKPKA